jgi:hypothetical protein
MHNFFQIVPHLPRYFEKRQSRKTRVMNPAACQRKVRYVDQSADLGSGRRDYENSAPSELGARAFVLQLSYYDQ